MEINNNTHNIFSSNITPNPMSVKYWADLSVDPSGSVIKTYKNGEWVSINSDDKQDQELNDIKSKINNLETSVSNKQNKETGKGLSTNDYTTAEKNKLASLNNYNDSSIVADIANLESIVAGLHNYNDTEVRELISALTLKVSTLEERVTALETPTV